MKRSYHTGHKGRTIILLLAAAMLLVGLQSQTYASETAPVCVDVDWNEVEEIVDLLETDPAAAEAKAEEYGYTIVPPPSDGTTYTAEEMANAIAYDEQIYSTTTEEDMMNIQFATQSMNADAKAAAGC